MLTTAHSLTPRQRSRGALPGRSGWATVPGLLVSVLPFGGYPACWPLYAGSMPARCRRSASALCCRRRTCCRLPPFSWPFRLEPWPGGPSAGVAIHRSFSGCSRRPAFCWANSSCTPACSQAAASPPLSQPRSGMSGLYAWPTLARSAPLPAARIRAHRSNLIPQERP